MAAQTFMTKKDDGPEATRTTTESRTVNPSPDVVVTKGRFAVRLDPQHPAGQYNRAGVKFIADQDVYFESVPEAIQADPWLMVAKIEGDAPPAYNSAERRGKQAARQL